MNLSYRFISFVSKIFPVSPFISKILTPSPAYPLHSNRPGGGGWSFHMSYYSANILRCTHIKTNGTQCGSPAVRGRRFCFFHKNWHGERIPLGALPAANLNPSFTLPVLEDADSIQVALMQVMRLILARQIDPKMAGLLLYALQTASVNLRHTELEPRPRERVVIDPAPPATLCSANTSGAMTTSKQRTKKTKTPTPRKRRKPGEASDDEEEEVEDDEEEEKEGDDTLHVGTGALGLSRARGGSPAPLPSQAQPRPPTTSTSSRCAIRCALSPSLDSSAASAWTSLPKRFRPKPSSITPGPSSPHRNPKRRPSLTPFLPSP